MRGSALLSFMGPGVTATEMRDIASSLLDPGFHRRAAVLSRVVEGTETQRREAFRALVGFILTQQPKQAASAPWRVLKWHFIGIGLPDSMTRWAEHLDTRKADGHTESVRVSSYLYAVLCAVEDLFGKQGYVTFGEKT